MIEVLWLLLAVIFVVGTVVGVGITLFAFKLMKVVSNYQRFFLECPKCGQIIADFNEEIDY